VYEHKIFFLAYGSDYYDTGHSAHWFEHKKFFLAYGSDIKRRERVFPQSLADQC
jgi:hypothetical protein